MNTVVEPKIFQTMFNEAYRLGLPTSYASDLLVDQRWLSREDAPVHFLWTLRELGTHVVSLQPEHYLDIDERNRPHKLIDTIQSCFGHKNTGRDMHSYACNAHSGQIRPISYPRARQLAEEAYWTARRIKRENRGVA